MENVHTTPFPSWAPLAFSLFANQHGEQWIAALIDGTLVVAGGDMDWEELRATPEELLAGTTPLSFKRTIFNREEYLWLGAVFCRARERLLMEQTAAKVAQARITK